MKVPVTINDLLGGHIGLDLECLDRIYLNGYAPTLQTSGQVASFLTVHLGNPIPSPALFEKIGTRFRADVRDYAARHGIAWVQFRKGDRKIDVVRPLLDKAAATGRGQVVAVGVAQEFQYVAADRIPAPLPLRQALRTIDSYVGYYIGQSRLGAPAPTT
jgi:hypothetical protein